MFAFGLGGTMQLIPAISSIVCDGLFDRFPKLKVLVVEAGAGFAAYVMDRLDEKFDRFGAFVPLKNKPSDYFRRNLWYVMDPQERSIDAQCDLVGEDRFLWGSDYPHIDSHIKAADEVRSSLATMSEHRQRLVLGENARQLFDLVLTDLSDQRPSCASSASSAAKSNE